ncbi:FadR/GntR family transcriptional regulator [Microbacterium trichothecenolyticum]|uniref:DNA-binding FadR family transcriptional regulator n=1 Tax=Microbacterium trichothecenolyticum TaxID=69370 RepID=A0ABU0TQE9_MICTR|nr:FCD domain-containing protein [Microbacterium trichothecenolyticum]MDQ1121665.1 DNA-binding FadR family transcriptional regulator [Microbacterium trichothecenolyticum]
MDRPTVASLHDALVDRLGSAIVDGQLAAGSRLVTAELSPGSSRGAGREAVRVLQSLGLVRVRRKTGVEVLPVTQWNVYAPEIIAWRLAGPGRTAQLRELSELRGAIEPLAARSAAVHATDAQRQELVAAVMEMARTERDADGAEYLAADVRFHRTLLAASGNTMFGALGSVVESVLVGRTLHELMPHDANPHAVRWHQDVAFAVAAGRAEEAAQAMSLIVREAGQAMASAISAQ